MTAYIRIIEDATACAHLFRLGRDIEAALNMVDLVDRAMPLVPTRPVEEQAMWTQVLTAMLECQERQDWLGVADWLEYEMVGLVRMALEPV